MKQRKQIESLLFSTVGVAAMFLILVGVYLIGGVVKARVDLTEDKLYTLSKGSRAILEKLDTPVEIRFYYTPDARDMPLRLKTYAEEVSDLLNEYRKAAPRGMIVINRINPKPDSDAEESAALDGIQGQMTNSGERIYFGIAISQLDAKATVPFLSPDRERLLEYDISRAITAVTNPEKPVVGVMSALPVFGEMDPRMMQMGQMRRSNPWVFVSELRRDFEVRELQLTAGEIPDEVEVLVVVHPKGISEQAQFAIDQFVLRGGKLLAFLDPLSVVDSMSNPQMNPMQAAASGGSTLDRLLPAWGVTFDTGQVAADLNFLSHLSRGGRAEPAPAVLTLTSSGIDPDDVVTSQIDNLLLPFSGTFSGTPAAGLEKTVLLKTTSNSQLVDRFMAEFSGEQVHKDFASSGREHALAIRLTGKFKTAFPEGRPGGDHFHDDDDDHDHPPSSGAGLTESVGDGAVILVGDADLLFDQFTVQVQEFFGQRIIIPRNQNLNLVQNMIEQLAGDSNLIAIRSRGTRSRPFTVVREMQTQASERYQATIKRLEEDLQETQARLNALQTERPDGQRFILSSDQQDELARFEQRKLDVQRELREVRRDLRRETDSLENRLKWINIAGMPLLVTLSGISLALIKRKKTAAK